MTPDLLLLGEIMDGPRRAGEINMPRSTRKKWAAILEERGLLLRERLKNETRYIITKQGRKFAAGNGIMPVAMPYFLDIPANAALEPAEVIHKLSTDVQIIDYIGTLAMIGFLSSGLTWLLMIWTGYIQ